MKDDVTNYFHFVGLHLKYYFVENEVQNPMFGLMEYFFAKSILLVKYLLVNLFLMILLLN